MSSDVVKRRLNELRVVDLRSELEKRGMDKNGVKATLCERLAAALKNEGLDPETYQFVVVENSAGKKMTKKRKGEAENDDDDEEEQPYDSFAESGTMDRNELNDDSVEQRSTSHTTSFNRTMVATDDENNGDVLIVGVDADANEDFDVDNNVKVPNPENVEPQCQFTSEDTINLHAAATMKKNGNGTDETNSMFVNPDETMSDLDQSENTSSSANTFTQRSTSMPDVKQERNGETAARNEAATLEVVKKEVNVAENNEKEVEKTSSVEGTCPQDHADGENKQPQEKKGNNKSEPTSSHCSVYVRGISNNTKAADLKSLFSKYATVNKVKVMSSKSAKEGSKYFGYLTLSSAEEATNCIQHLHRTELLGKMISVERATAPPNVQKMVNNDKKSNEPDSTTSATSNVKEASSTVKSEKDAKNESDEKQQKPANGKSGRSEKVGDVAGAGKKASSVDKDKKDKERRSSKTRSRSGDKTRIDRGRRSSRDRRSSDRERERRREALRNRAAARRPVPYSSSSRPVYRPRPPAPPIMNRRIGQPPMRPARAPDRYESSVVQRMRLLEARREREREELEKYRQKETEHRQREEILRLQREKERLKFEREKLEREKLEFQHQQQLRMQQAYERMAPPQMIGVKRSYDAVTSYPQPDAKRAYTTSGTSRSGRERSPRSYSNSNRDSYRGGADRYESRDPRSNRIESSRSTSGRDDYRTSSSSSSRRQDTSSSRPSRSSATGGSGERRYPSPPRRGREPPPPPPPPRPAAWTGGSSSSSSSRYPSAVSSSGHRDAVGYSSSRQSNNYAPSSRAAPPAAPTVWPNNAAPILSNQGGWTRAGPITGAVTTGGVWTPTPTANMFSAPGGNVTGSSYPTDGRFDAYKYPSARRY